MGGAVGMPDCGFTRGLQVGQEEERKRVSKARFDFQWKLHKFVLGESVLVEYDTQARDGSIQRVYEITSREKIGNLRDSNLVANLHVYKTLKDKIGD